MEQDRAYWEVHIGDAGQDGAFLMVGSTVRGKPDLLAQELGASPMSYGARIGAGGKAPLQAGDVVGCSYDQAVYPPTIMYWVNGSQVTSMEQRGMKGEQWPALFVSGCTVDWALDETHWKSSSGCPTGFSQLMASTSLIGGGG